jgi:uncharacterized protein (TIGR02145 family)
LENCLEGVTAASVAGGAMKETGTSHWTTPNTGASNISGWAGLPSGLRNFINGLFFDIGLYGFWWSSTEFTTSNANAHNWTLQYDLGTISGFYSPKKYGFSVRCLRD